MSTRMAQVLNSPSRKSSRLQHLQILRAIAASLVVVNHTFSSLQPHGLDLPGFQHSAELIGGLGVAVFFVISGLIMVRHAADRFGSPASPFIFACHRLLRIVPIYWIATLLWYRTLRHNGPPIPFGGRQLLLSLFFIPNFLSSQGRLNPLLGQGWTLNYEMAFYLLFAVSLFLRRPLAIPGVLAAIVLAASFGFTHHPSSSLVRFYTDRIILLFAAGVLLGAVEIALNRATPCRFPISPAFLLLLSAGLLLWRPTLAPAFDPYSWSGLVFATALVALCSLSVNQPSGWFTRGLVLLGDASYSTYLCHLWVFGWTNPRVLRVYAHLHRTPETPFAFIAAAVCTANLLGLGVHLVLERPVTLMLRKVVAGKFSRTQPLPAPGSLVSDLTAL